MRISGITYAPRKTHKVRNTTVLIILLILILAIAVVVISGIVGWSLVHPKHKSLETFSANIGPEYREVEFKDIKNAVKLKGWFFEKKGSTKTVILAHGYKQNRLQFSEKTLDMIKAFLGKEYNVLTFDFRNCGQSEGDTTTVGKLEKDDLLGAITYAKDNGSKHVVLMGFSMGASTSIMAAAESLQKDEIIDAVIADSPFSDLGEYLNGSLQNWSPLPRIFNGITLLSIKLLTGVDPYNVSPKKSMENLGSIPVMLIHSKDDSAIPFSNSEELYSVYNSSQGTKGEFWQVSGVDHVGAYEKHPQEYMDRVFKFLDKVYEQE